MNSMPSRLEYIDYAIRGYEQTGVSLIYYNGKFLSPVPGNSDVGVYYFIPLVARLFDLNAEQAASFFYYGILGFFLALSLIGSFFLFRSPVTRGLTVLGLAWLGVVSINSGSVYSIPSAVIAGILPWFLYFSGKNQLTPLFLGVGVLSGMVIGFSHSVRVHGATGLILFMVVVVFFLIQYNLKDKIKLTTAIVVGLLIPVLCFAYLTGKRDAYLSQQKEVYQPASQGNLIWHSIYIGLGYLSNPLGIEYKDASAFEKVRSISPNAVLYSKEYVEVLKTEVIRIFKTHKNFILHTVFAKTGVMLFFLLYSANLGLIAAYCYPKKRALEFAFLIAILFSAIPGILVMPYRHYVLGFMTFSLFYGLVSINEAVERGVMNRIQSRFRPKSE